MNTINKLKDEGGGEVAGRFLKSFIANHYQQLFLSTACNHVEDVLDCVQEKVSHDMNVKLTVPLGGGMGCFEGDG